MFHQIVLGSVMIIVTTLFYGMMTGYTVLRIRRRYQQQRVPHSDWVNALIVAVFVLWLCLVTVGAMLCWVALYVHLDVFATFEEALYFSMVTMTTVGYGDVITPTSWRLLAGFQAINGSFIFGFSTAFTFAVVEATYRLRSRLPGQRASGPHDGEAS